MASIWPRISISRSKFCPHKIKSCFLSGGTLQVLKGDIRAEPGPMGSNADEGNQPP